MPLLRFDLVRGRSPETLRMLLDATHDAMREAFDVPVGDRYQVVHEHPASHLIVEDTGLGISRTHDRVVLQVTTRPRSEDMKREFYRLLCLNLEERCGIAPSDVVVTITSNTDADWSFGHGRAQFLTGEL